jgi:hypothetical protein
LPYYVVPDRQIPLLLWVPLAVFFDLGGNTLPKIPGEFVGHLLSPIRPFFGGVEGFPEALLLRVAAW